jgi:hypothetical protein
VTQRHLVPDYPTAVFGFTFIVASIASFITTGSIIVGGPLIFSDRMI